METIHNYRHIIDKKVSLLFENALKKAITFNPPKHLGFIGLILNYNKIHHHDIDVLIFPNKGAKLGEAIIEIMQLYDEVEKIIKKSHPKYYLATCSKKSMQELTYYLASLEEGSAGLIPVHSLFFPDYKSFIKFNPKNFLKSIKTNLINIYGNFSILNTLPTLPPEKLEPYFVIIDFEMSSRIKTFPRHNIRASAESLFQYLHDKYGIKTIKKIPNDINKIQEEFIRLLRLIDKETYK